MVTRPSIDALAVTPAAAVKRISWAAVFAGVILAMVVQLLLSMLGTGIGMSTVDPLQGETPGGRVLGLGAGIWWAVSSLIALFISGWVAAHLAGIPRTVDGVLHGLLTWGLSTLMTFYLLSTAVGSMIGGAFKLAGGVASTAAQTVGAVAPEAADAVSDQLKDADISWNGIKQQALTLLRQTGKPALQPGAIEQKTEDTINNATDAAQDAAQTPTATDAEFESLLDKLIRQGESIASAADREALINVLVARGMSRDEAAKTVDNWQQTYEQGKAKAEQLKVEAETKARAVADQTADAVSEGALWGFFVLLLGAIAAAIGGAVGRPRTALTQPL
jgi:hypothetical protein